MLNKTRKLITGVVLSLSAAVLLLLLLVTQAQAGSGPATTTLTTSTNISASTATNDLILNHISAKTTVVDADHVLGILSNLNASSIDIAGETGAHIMTLDAGSELIMYGNLASTSAGSMTYNMGASSAARTNTLSWYGTTATDKHKIVVLSGNATTNISTINIGNGVSTSTWAGTINLGNVGSGTTNFNLNGAIISGVISDGTTAVADMNINVLGDSTLSAANDIAHSTANTEVIITDSVTLTLSDSFTIGAAGKFILGTGATGGTLVLGGADDYLGLINGSADGVGILDINAASTVTSIVGGSSLSLASVDIDAATTFSAKVSATTIDVANNTTFTGAAATTLNISADVTAIFNAAVNAAITTGGVAMGTIDVNTASVITGAIGVNGANTLKLLDIDANTTTTSTVDATSTDIAAVTLIAQGDITSIVHFSADGALTLADTADVTGAITAAAGNDTGTITVNGVSIVTGEIGTSGATLNQVTVGDGAGTDKLSVSGGLHATSTTVDAGGELHFTHATAAAMQGAVSTGATTGKINVGTATVTVTGAVAIGATSTLGVTIGTTNGKLIGTAANIVTNSNSLIEPVIAGRITSGTAITISQSGAAQIVPTTGIVESYERYTFAVAVCSGAANDLCLTPTLVTPAGITGNGAKVNAIADVAFAADSTMNDAIQGLSGAVLQKALISLAPAVDGGAIVGAVSAGSASGATISTQMASLRSGIAAGQGLNAGDRTAGEERFWTQGFGTYAEQDIRETVAGFTAATGGVAFGVDDRFRDDLVLGLAYSYSHTNVNSSESKNETAVQGHQATLYGSHDLDKGIFDIDGLFLDGQLSYAYNDYDGERNIDVGAVSRRADSAYEGMQISTKFDLGKTIELDDGFRFTPTAGFSYTHVSIDSYNETNAGASNLRLSDQDYDMLSLNLRGKLARTLQVDGIDVTPEAHLGYSYETIHDKIQTLSTFEGGGDAFTSTGFAPANNTFLGGVGVTWGGDSMPVDVTLTYDAAHKEDFLSHSALVKGVWRF